LSAAIVNFVRWRRPSPDWTEQEIAEFLRVADSLRRSGFDVATERGLTDEGDPWFIFVRESTEEVIAHFARINGEFIADASAVAEPVRGRDLRHVLDQVVNRYTVFVPRRREDNLFLHPAAMLTAFVATALMELDSGGQRHVVVDELKTGTRGEGALGRVTQAAATTPVNAPGRAISFADQGVLGEHLASNTGHILTTVLTALTLADITFGPQDNMAVAGDLQAVAEAAQLAGISDATPVRAVERAGDDAASTAPSGDAAAPSAETAEPVEAPAAADNASYGPVPTAIAGDAESVGLGAELVAAPAGPEPVAADVPERALATEASGPASSEAQAQAPAALAQAENDFTLDLVSFGQVTLHLDALEVIFAPADDGDTVNLIRRPAGESEAPESPVAPVPQSAPSVSEFVFAGSSSQNETLRAIVDYVQESLEDPQAMSFDDRTFLGQTVMAYAGGRDDFPEIVAFESDSIQMTTFAFMPGVIFMKESALGTDAPEFDDSPETVALSDGGSVSLLGVVTLDPVFA